MTHMYFSITMLVHLLITVGAKLVKIGRTLFCASFLFLAISSYAGSLDLDYPGFMWGRIDVSSTRQVYDGVIQQGIRVNPVPLVPYVETSYYKNTLDNIPTTEYSLGIYNDTLIPAVRVGAEYVWYKTSIVLPTTSEFQVYATIYKEWE